MQEVYGFDNCLNIGDERNSGESEDIQISGLGEEWYFIKILYRRKTKFINFNLGDIVLKSLRNIQRELLSKQICPTNTN